MIRLILTLENMSCDTQNPRNVSIYHFHHFSSRNDYFALKKVSKTACSGKFWSMKKCVVVFIVPKVSPSIIGIKKWAQNNQRKFHQICKFEIGLLRYFIIFQLKNLVKWGKRPISNVQIWWNFLHLFWAYFFIPMIDGDTLGTMNTTTHFFKDQN